MKHYRNIIEATQISAWLVIQLPLGNQNNFYVCGVANIKSHPMSHPYVVNNAHPVTWTPYANFHPDCSINEFLVGIMRSYGCGNNQTTPIDTRD